MDPRTVTVLMMLTGAECSLLFFISGAIRRQTVSLSKPPSLFWGVGTAIHVVGVFGLLTQGHSSPWFGIIFANSAIILGQLLMLVGVRRLFSRKLALLRYAIFLIVYILLAVLFTFLNPSNTTRVILFSCFISAFYFEGAAICYMARSKATDPLAPAVAAIFGLFSLFFLARAAVSFLFPQASPFTKNFFNTATFVVSHFGLIIWCLGLILMQNRLTEVDLERAYDEKAVLLRELQHRVKNSISVIAGLVSLESSHVQDARFTALLEGLQDRIGAIGALYDQLFQSGETEYVELDVYLTAVAESLFSGQAADDRGIALELELERVRIDAKRAVPLGLIANELLTDSLKYAFPDGRNGKIRLSMRREEADFVLEVRDDGVGLPADFAVGASAGLGLVLVEMLAQQVGGTLSVESGNLPIKNSGFSGACFSVRFPEAVKG
jgi:two-component sensor histidine kinase